MNSFFLSCQLPPNAEGSAEPARRKGQGCVHRLEYLIPVSFAGFLPLTLVGYGVSLIFTASLRSSKNGSLAITQRQFFLFRYGQISFLRPFKNDRQVFNTVL